MLLLPPSTEVRRHMPKAQIYRKFEIRKAVADAIDRDIARLDFIHWIAPQTLPAIAAGGEVKEIFVVEVTLKLRDFAPQSLAVIARSIPQHIVFLLRYAAEVRLALYHAKLFLTPWTPAEAATLPLAGLNLDTVWQNLVAHVGGFTLAPGLTLEQQIKENEQQARLDQRIATLERQMRSTPQLRRQRELYEEIKQLRRGK